MENPTPPTDTGPVSAPVPDAAPFSTNPFGAVIGNPNQDAAQWDGQQTLSDDCAVRAQQFIIEQFSGQKLDEQALVNDAYAHGWYAPGSGTSLQDMNKELTAHGIPSTTYQHANMFELANELAQGHKVIIATDSNELWHGTPTGAADHAVVVSGIDTTDPNNVQVIVSDPGVPNGAEDHYPLAQFVTAWQSSNFYMVATDQPAPAGSPGMQNFDYSSGHIPQVANLPYDQFQNLVNNPDQVQQLFGAASGGSTITPLDIFHDANPSVYPPQPLDSPFDQSQSSATDSSHDLTGQTVDAAHLPTADLHVPDHWPPPGSSGQPVSGSGQPASDSGQLDSGSGHAGALEPHWDLGERYDSGHDLMPEDHTGGEAFDHGF